MYAQTLCETSQVEDVNNSLANCDWLPFGNH